MPRVYFEPQNMDALAEVFSEAKKILDRQGLLTPESMDDVAKRIFQLASKGTPPCTILGEVLMRRQLEAQPREARLKVQA
jgi:hypothetical protein